MKANFIAKALRSRHNTSDWVFATEVKTATGTVQAYSRGGVCSERFIDAFALNLWPSKKFWRVAYEIKVDRGDFIRELEDPTKRAQALLLSNEFYFALAPGIFGHADLSKYDIWDEGILEIQEDGSIKTIQKARKRAAYPMPDWFTASLLRCVRDEGWGQSSIDSPEKQFEITEAWAERIQP